MALIHKLDNPHEDVVPSTFHEAIKHFMRPPNPNSKPPLPTFKKHGKKRDSRLEKSEFELSKESAHPAEENLSPRRFDGSTTSFQFKSPAVYCEVMLAEMLSRGKQSHEKPSTPGKYSEAPDAYRTSVCCQVLTDMCKVAAPFVQVLSTIQNELELAIYSNYVTPSTTTIFEQVPYFDLVSSLEKKNNDILRDQERWKSMVAEKQLDIDRMNVHIKELKQCIGEERESLAELQSNLTSTIRAFEKSNKEVARLADQVAKSRFEVLHAREVGHRLEDADVRYETLMAKHLSIIHELQHCQSNLEVARKEAADGVPKREMAIAKAQIKELQHKLLKAEILTEQMDHMTPRPHWALLRGGTFYTMSSAAQAAEVCKLNDLLLENVTSLRLECATAQVAFAELKQQKKGGRSASPRAQKPADELARPKSS